MSEEATEVQELTGVKVEEVSPKATNKPKFLVIGKYFLFVILFAGQALLAYTLVDRNYADAYEMLYGNTEDSFVTYQMEELVINPAQTNGQRYLLVEIGLELYTDEHISLLEKNKLKLKQDMIEALSARTIPQLTTSEGRDILREHLIRIINRSIGQPSVRNLYFTKYVMQ
jgi:flagellar FliL protein